LTRIQRSPSVQREKLGVLELTEHIDTLEVVALESNPDASPGSVLGLDYVFLTKN